jgi:lipopolysaccharide heptosyltransferase II
LKKTNLKPDEIKRIVVRLPNWLGDVVMSVPALRELRRIAPTAHITLVSRPGTADVFIDADFADEVLTYTRRGWTSAWNQAREWRRRRFDVAVIFQNAFEAAAIAFLARVRTRIGYTAERRGALLTHQLPLPAWKNDRHESFYYLNVVAELERLLGGNSGREKRAPNLRLEVTDSRKQRARQILKEHGVRRREPLVLLCPGSINSRAKRWPVERYAALADQFIEAGVNVALIGSAAETDVSREVCEHALHPPVVLTGKTTVDEVISIISIADVLITNDTGPAHLGAALGTPTLVVFGPTNPLTTYPLSPTAEIIRRPPDCAPCMLRDCPIDHRCMTAISPAEVFERASERISSRLRPELKAPELKVTA